MRCEDVQLELSARLDDAADPRLDPEIDSHLQTCADCRRFRDRALRLRSMARDMPATPAPDLVEPIMERVRSQPRRASRIGPRTVFVAVASAAAVAAIAVAVSLTRPTDAERRMEAIRIIRTRTLLVWTPSRVTPAVADAVGRLEGVAGVARVRSGVVWLDGWTDSAGREHRPRRGLRVPVEIAGIDTETYARFVPAPDASVLSHVGPGGIALGDTGAALRGITSSGGSLEIGGAALTVAGLVDDVLIGAHEGVVSLDTARTLGITRIRYLLVALADGADPDEVAGRIRGAITDDTPVRVRALGESPYLRHGDAVLPQVRVKQLFGEFAAAEASNGNLRVDPAWTNANIVTARVPLLGTVRCHREIVASLRAAMTEIERGGLASLVRPDDFGGCFFPRYLSQDRDAGISHHSWGIAFDVNVGTNAFGKPPQLDQRVVEIVERHGFTWGGRWLVPDGMHFEFVRSVEP